MDIEKTPGDPVIKDPVVEASQLPSGVDIESTDDINSQEIATDTTKETLSDPLIQEQVDGSNGAPSNDEEDTKVDESTQVTSSDTTEKASTEPIEKPVISPIENTSSDQNDSKQPTATPEPTIPQKKKRLTLQERLALAANKGGSKTIKKKAQPSSNEATPRTSIDSSRPSLDSESEPVVKLDIGNDSLLFPPNYQELDHSQLIEHIKASILKFGKVNEQLVKEQSSNQDLRIRLTTKDSDYKALEKKFSENNTSLLTKKLQEKENLINDLMVEGSKLSMKELNLSNTIKKLKSKTSEDAALLEDLQEKLDSTLNKLATFELKEVELKDFDTKKEQLTSDFKSLETRHNKLQEDHTKISQQYKELKAQRFEQQLETTKLKLDEEVKKNRELTTEVEQLNIKLKLLKDQSKSEVAELEEKLQKQQQRFLTSQEESSSEIKRLEDKMELLRIMAESSSNSKNDETSNEAYKKLASSNDLLQSQYTLAQENWKFIESSYLNKLAQAEKDINTLKQKDLTSMKKMKVLTGDLKSKNEELEEAMERSTTIASEMETLKTAIESKNRIISELEKKVKSLLDEIKQVKIDFDTKLQDELAKQRESIEKELESSNKSFDGPIQQQGLYINDLVSNPSFLKTRSISNLSWNDNIAFGESSTTPRSSHLGSRKTSSAFLNQFNNGNNVLRTPLADNGLPKFLDSPREAIRDSSFDHSFNHDSYFEDDIPEESDSPSSQNSSKFTLNKDAPALSGIGSAASNFANKHIQLIGKLSAQIRRLEIESLTLKDEIANLNNVKNESNNEIVKLLKENSEVRKLKNENDELTNKVSELDKKYQRTLELLGEKSERVEELSADVDDLKQLCREQVQQLVELQTK